jgi:GT2 family glycosyltransferase
MTSAVASQSASGADDDLPEIAIGLLSYNRADEVLRTLRLLAEIDYPPDRVHLVVVDNASSDGTRERVLEEFGSRVEIIRLEENIGAIARNRVLLGRREPYIFQFDEDTAPADRDTIRRAVLWMQAHPRFGALCFRSLNVNNGRSDWGPLEMFARRRLRGGAYEGLFLIGNGMCFRRDAVQRTMGYDPRIFWGAEELHFCLELLYHDISIAYHPDLVIVHRQLPRAMPRAQVVEMEVRNNIRAYMTFMPIALGVAMSVMHCLRRLGQAAKHRNRDHAAATFRGARRAIGEMGEVLATRRPIPMARFARNNRWIFLTFIGLPASPEHPGDRERIARTNDALARHGAAHATNPTTT